MDSQFVQDPGQDFSLLRWGLKEWKRVCPYLLKDFYVLTPWHTGTDTSGFTAFAYFDPDAASGVLLAFRQETCREDMLSVSLPFAGAHDQITLTDEDTGETTVLEGKDAASGGVALHFSRPRQARLLWIHDACSID